MSKNDRPILEILSWKATIISTILAALGLYFSLFSTSSKPQDTYNQHAGNNSTQIGKIEGNVTFNAQPSEPLTVITMSHESFWEAITRNDINTMEKLEKNGMKLKPEFLTSYFSLYYTPENFAILEQYNAISDSGCPTDVHSLKFYNEHSTDVKKAKSIRQTCSTNTVISIIEHVRKEVATSNAKALELQVNYPSKVRDCQQNQMNKHSTINWLKEASKFTITSVSSYTLEQEILANINAALISGQITSQNANQFITKIIDQTCHRYYIPPKPNEKLLSTFDQTLRFLTTNV